MDGQHQVVDVPVHAISANRVLPQTIMEEDFCWIAPRVPPTTQSVKILNSNELTFCFPGSVNLILFRSIWHEVTCVENGDPDGYSYCVIWRDFDCCSYCVIWRDRTATLTVWSDVTRTATLTVWSDVTRTATLTVWSDVTRTAALTVWSDVTRTAALTVWSDVTGLLLLLCDLTWPGLLLLLCNLTWPGLLLLLFDVWRVVFRPDVIPGGWLGSKRQLTNWYDLSVQWVLDTIPQLT